MRFGVAFGLCIVLLTMFAGDRGLPAVFKARRQAHTLAREVGALREQNQALRARVLALRNDPVAIESVARETLGLARRGELVVFRRR
jgi:cell division protein FtsB